MNILLVDDEENILRALKRVFRDRSWNVFTALGAEEALQILAQEKIDLLITDYRMPGKNGLELIREARKNQPQLPCFVLTGEMSLAIPDDILPTPKLFAKPWDGERFIAAIQEIQKTL